MDSNDSEGKNKKIRIVRILDDTIVFFRDGEVKVVKRSHVEKITAERLRKIHRETLKSFILMASGPPEAAQDGFGGFLIDLLLPAETAEDFRINIDEIYPIWLERHGEKRTNVLIKKESLAIIWATYKDKFKGLFGFVTSIFK